MDRGLLQRDCAEQLGINLGTWRSWEKGQTRPNVRLWPAVIAFLGYNPTPAPQTLGERLRARRWELGLTQREFAKCLGVASESIWEWEAGNHRPTAGRIRAALHRELGRTSRSR